MGSERIKALERELWDKESLKGVYIGDLQDPICLDGHFSLEGLKDVVAIMEKFKEIENGV